MGILDSINQPSDLKSLSLDQLQKLAEELRSELVGRISANGGHLASSLGAVELSIALHRVFNSPVDKIVWDVGHQSYAHKLLTGRRDRFATIRQQGGLSGFTDPSESVHDAFVGGHASNSVSAALGMALARDLAGERYHVVAVIGDAAITGGMAVEALNHWGHIGTRMIVVLNDNGMAISPSVGAFSRFLNRMRLDPRYEAAKRRAKATFSHLPFGEPAWAAGKRIKGRVKRALVPGALWEEFGFTYVGPVDGHDIKSLESALTRARDYESKPTFVHVITKKGKGYPPAEEDAVTFHGIAPSGAKSVPGPSYSQVFGQTVVRLMRENPRVVAITAAMLDGTGLAPAQREFPKRVFDVGICEQHAVTLAAGLASRGFIPVVAIYSTFLQRAFDQIVHDVCIQGLPVVFAIDRAGIVGDDGKTHQGTLDISYLGTIPGLIVATPKDENELQHLLFTATRIGRPMAIRYPRGSGPGASLDADLHDIAIGKGEILRSGRDVAVLALGTTVYPSLEAAQILEQKGLDCAVINARFAKPLDADLILDTASKLKRVLTVEENTLAGGFGSSVLQLLQSHGLCDVQTRCLGIPDEFVEHASQQSLRTRYHLDAPGIASQITSSFADLRQPLLHNQRRSS
ncbi:MAG: 1-deoxy-D-xylulose-5-phosphate synthase [Dehalococcoidia bacterium]|nr:1-deoxy-D-xylulose-5-phosphate synthase [Dehalococcoidia bacterium]